MSPNIFLSALNKHFSLPTQRCSTIAVELREHDALTENPVAQLPSGVPQSANLTDEIVAPGPQSSVTEPVVLIWNLSFSSSSAQVLTCGGGGAGGVGILGQEARVHRLAITPRDETSEALTLLRLICADRYSQVTAGLSHSLLHPLASALASSGAIWIPARSLQYHADWVPNILTDKRFDQWDCRARARHGWDTLTM